MMMKDVTYKNQRRSFKIYQYKDITKAEEAGHALDGIELIKKRYPFVDENWLKNNKRFYVKDKVTADVRCHEEDVQNDDIGRREAVDKLNRKIRVQREAAVKLFEAFLANQVKSPATKKK